MRRNIEAKLAIEFVGAVADAAGIVTVNNAHVKRLGGFREHVLEKVPEAVLESDAEQAEFTEVADGGQVHHAEYGSEVVEACAHLQVGVGEYAETVQGLDSVNGVGRCFRVAVVAKDSRLAIVALVVIANGDDRNREARFKRETLRYGSACIPVAVEHVAQVVDNGLDVTGTIAVLAVERGHGFKLGGPTAIVHSGCCCGSHNKHCEK